ncbi:hypothetical protein [Delftia tsuruhatensis]|uniref:hypothetical protein n=1 Tax=Delftia tsuruhatensis TaxID=180282 RepID=UPI001F395483|nr:hypothetical protein [Delftia tsuruhatensis]
MIKLPNYDPGSLVAGKKPWQSAAENFSPYDYTQYCRKWSKANLTCTASDREPGRDVKTPSDYIPKEIWKTKSIPEGYSCDSPYYFLDMEQRGSAPTAGIDDLADAVSRIINQRRK